MPVLPMPDILRPAFEQRYGVAAFNTVDDVTMDAILGAAVEMKSPVIIQISVKTVRFWGAKLIQLMFAEMASRVPIPTTLHLDHCPDRGLIEECLAAGWNSVLFDGSELNYEENTRNTKEVVALAHECGAAVEGELTAVKKVEEAVGDDYGGPVVSLDKTLEFVRETGIDSFAAGIGTAHGLYKGEPRIDFDRVSQIVAAEPIPLVIHGGSGLSDGVFTQLIARGETKVNISTNLKITFTDAFRGFQAAQPAEYEPLKLLGAVREDVKTMAMRFIQVFGSEGKA